MKSLIEKIEEERGNEADYTRPEDKKLVRHWNNCIDVVLEIIQSHINEDWISAKDKLPEDLELVLIQGSTGRMYVGYGAFGGQDWYCKTSKSSSVNGIKPIAWRPLPEQYKEITYED